MNAPARRLHAVDRVLELGTRPWLMGIVAESPDSGGLAGALERAPELLGAGADILDVQAGSPTDADRPHDVERRIDGAVALIERLACEPAAIVSVSTSEPELARAAIDAGACIVNDPTGRCALAELCARTGAAFVVPPGNLKDALAAGVARDRLIVAPGLDRVETPRRAIELLGGLARLHELEVPLLIALPRKHVLRALLGGRSDGLLGGELAALASVADAGAHIFRLDDVEAASDFLKVRAALSGALEPSRDLALAEELRYEPSAVE